MKTNYFTSALITLLFAGVTFAQDVTTVTATNYDISDNLDLTAVASIFGESKDLADFEYRLNNPKTQISNLDLNRDGKVDYLRVIESIEGNTHLIVLQSVIGIDLYQDIATIEVEKDLRNNKIQVQVVGDVFLYGNNYIYEPVYYLRPIIFNTFWTRGYAAYYSPWYWGYYPTYFSYWTPYPIFRYRTHVHTYVNVYNTYNYVNIRRSNRAIVMHNSVRSNAYERQNPNRSFHRRNEGINNSYTLSQTRINIEGNVNNTRTSSMNTNASNRNNSIGRTDSDRTNSVNTNSSARSNSIGISDSNRIGSLNSSSPTRSSSAGITSSSRATSVNTSSDIRNNSVGTTNTNRTSSLNTNSTNIRNNSLENHQSTTRSSSTSINNPNSTRSSMIGVSSPSNRNTSLGNGSNTSKNNSTRINSSTRSSTPVGNTSSSSRTIR